VLQRVRLGNLADAVGHGGGRGGQVS
jgi:hypothetical protein